MVLFATLISRIFDPFLMFAVVFVVTLWGTPKFVPAFMCMAFFPFFLYFIAWRTKYISNWDMNNRSERPKILWILIGIEIVSLFVFQLWSLLPIVIAFIGFAVITHFWKISGHAMTAAMAASITVMHLGNSYRWIYLVIPLVCWARVVRKNHTTFQVIAGSLYAFLFTKIYETWQSIFR